MACFVGSIGTAFTGYLSQTNLDAQWISTQAKDGLNAVGIGAFFDVLDPAQMLLWANADPSRLGQRFGDRSVEERRWECHPHGALRTWTAAGPDQQTKWATGYGDALAKAPDGDPAKVKAAAGYGPVPTLATSYLQLARTGGLEQLLSKDSFFGGDATARLLLISDGAHLEEIARARSLGGDQWGMMNEAGNYPGQPWMWLYTFWYQVPPWSTSPNADALVWATMMVLTLALALLPFIPGLRSIPRLVPIYRLVWRDYYRRHPTRHR